MDAVKKRMAARNMAYKISITALNENLVPNIDVVPHPTGVQPLLHPVTGAGPALQAITGAMVDLIGGERSHAIPGVKPADLPQFLHDMERVEAFKTSQLIKDYMNLGMTREQATAAVITDADSTCHVLRLASASSAIAMALQKSIELQKDIEEDQVAALKLQQELDCEIRQAAAYYIIEGMTPEKAWRRAFRGMDKIDKSSSGAASKAPAPQTTKPKKARRRRHVPRDHAEMLLFLQRLFSFSVKLHSVAADGSCCFHCFTEFGPSWLLRQVVFYYYSLDPEMVQANIVPPSRLMHILCIDDKGDPRPASSSDDWGDQESLIALLRVLPGLDTIILVTPCGYSQDEDRGYGVRFDIYTRPVGCVTNELAITNNNVREILGPLSRDIDIVHNVSVEDIQLAMARSNGFRVIGFIGGHYSYFTGL